MIFKRILWTLTVVVVLVLGFGFFVSAHGAALLSVPFYVLPYMGMLLILLVAGSSLKWGLYGGITASLWAAGLTFMGFLTQDANIIHICAAIFTYFLIGTILGQGVSVVRRQQLELKANKQEQEMLLDHIETQIWYLQDEETYGLVNRSHAEFLGVKKEELTGKSLYDVRDSNEEIETCVTGNKQIFIQKKEVRSREWVLNVNGERRLLSITKTPKFDANNNVEYVICSAVDITERQRTEDERARLSFEYETVFQSTHDAMFLVDVVDDATFRFIRNNDAHVQATGLQTEDLRGRTPQEIIGEEMGNAVSENYRWCVQKRTAVSYEEVLDLPGGKRTWATVLTPVIEHDKVTFIVGSSRDITDRKRAETRLQQSESHSRSIVELIPDIIVQMSRDGKYLDVLTSAEDELRLPATELIHRTVVDVLGPDLGNRIMGCIEKALDTGKLQMIEYTLDVPAGETWFEARIVPSGEDRVLGLIRNITQRKRSEERIRYLSFHDSLTGLYNRAFAEQELSRLGVARQMPLSIVMADLNGLKMVNDSLGHADGDALLREAAAVLRAVCRSEDIVARWGGDEFLAVLPRTPADDAERIAHRIERECEERKSDSIPVSLAFGTATMEYENQDLNSLLSEAEDRLYRDKRRRRRHEYNRIFSALLQQLDGKNHEGDDSVDRVSAVVREIKSRLDLENAALDDRNM